MFENRRQLVVSRIEELVNLANQKFRINVPAMDIRFDLRGSTAGQAGHLNRNYYLRFNRDMMMNSAWDHLYKDTIPHELAHIICFHGNVDRGHGKVWRSVCIGLGGSGRRCHNEKVTYARGKTFKYTTDIGRDVILSQTRHNRVQRGGYYVFRGKGLVDKNCPFVLI